MGELYAPVPDQFEIERPMQPKKDVGDYVESEGFLVPRRFADLEEAQYAAGQGMRVLVRSEHPDEYSGPSGIGKSVELRPDEVSGEFRPAYRSAKSMLGKLFHYAEAAGFDPDSYVEQASASYWEKIPGANITVVADDAVEGRYHVFAAAYESKPWPVSISGAIVTEDGQIERQLKQTRDDSDMAVRHKEVIDLYNAIRSLGKFNDAHCPIMEMQVSGKDGRIYFLQYHRARDEAFVTDRLNPEDFSANDGWVKADAVRGAYIGKKALALAYMYPNFRSGSSRATGIELPEDGSMTTDVVYELLDEYLARQRVAHLLSRDFDGQYSKIADGHGPRSQMFKPQVSVLLGNAYDTKKRLGEEVYWDAFGKVCNEDYTVRIDTEVASDGRNAYVRPGNELTFIKPPANS